MNEEYREYRKPELFYTDNAYERLLRIPDEELHSEAIFFMVNLN